MVLSQNFFSQQFLIYLVIMLTHYWHGLLTAIASNGHGRMKMNQFIIEHFGLLRVVVAICDISE